MIRKCVADARPHANEETQSHSVTLAEVELREQPGCICSFCSTMP